jgi:hypothetical protein
MKINVINEQDVKKLLVENNKHINKRIDLLKKIEEYTIRDIQLTEKLFNYVEKALLDLKKQRKIISPEFKQDVDNEIKTTTSNPGSASQQILDFLSDGKIVSTKELKNKFNDIKIATVRKALLDLKKQKKIISPERAHYAINSLSKKIGSKRMCKWCGKEIENPSFSQRYHKECYAKKVNEYQKNWQRKKKIKTTGIVPNKCKAKKNDDIERIRERLKKLKEEIK